MTFNEANTVEQMVLDACVSNGWTYAAGPTLSRQASDVFVESSLLPMSYGGGRGY